MISTSYSFELYNYVFIVNSETTFFFIFEKFSPSKYKCLKFFTFYRKVSRDLYYQKIKEQLNAFILKTTFIGIFVHELFDHADFLEQLAFPV